MSDPLQVAKNGIRQELEAVVKSAVAEYGDGCLSREVNQAVCNTIEAVFIHGLKDAFFCKGSRYSKYPEPNFWPFVSKFAHRSVKNQINNQNQIKSEVGKARSWVRIVLNEGSLENYINIMCKDKTQLSQFYLNSAFLQDFDKVETLNGYLTALGKVPLDAPTNSTFLNTWTPTPLILAGLIQGKTKRGSEEDDHASVYSHPSIVDNESAQRPPTLSSTPDDSIETSSASETVHEGEQVQAVPIVEPVQPEPEPQEEPTQATNSFTSDQSEVALVPHVEDVDALHLMTAQLHTGNSIIGRGWAEQATDSMDIPTQSSSPGTEDSSGPAMSFGMAMRDVMDNRPDLSASESRKTSLLSTTHTTDPEDVTQTVDAVVIEPEHLDDSMEPDLLTRLTVIQREIGIDAQGYRCPDCRRSIGASFGAFKLCGFDGKNYCVTCFKKGADLPIPARVILNWDHRPRPVCPASRRLLKDVYDRPLIHLDRVNPLLYANCPDLEHVHQLRVKLSLVAMYLMSCKQSVAEDLKRRLWPSDYLFTDVHLYSMKDLDCVPSGVLERKLNTVITFATDHVTSCVLCVQKGFVCEICSAPKVIYPFQTEVTFRCCVCFSVYHRTCAQDKPCPRCARNAKNAERRKQMESF